MDFQILEVTAFDWAELSADLDDHGIEHLIQNIGSTEDGSDVAVIIASRVNMASIVNVLPMYDAVIRPGFPRDITIVR